MFALAASITWWFVLRSTGDPVAEPVVQEPISVALIPFSGEPPPPDQVAALEPQAVPASAPTPAEPEPADTAPAPDPEPPVAEPEPAAAGPPPEELGTPDGEGELAADAEVEIEADESATAGDAMALEASPAAAADAPRTATSLMSDQELLEAARAEVSGETRRGFATVLLASPEQQLGIARFFEETLVLVPRANLDPLAESPIYFRVAADGAERVETVAGRAPLEGFRQYRDLFDYEYARLPDSLRELRRSVFARSEIFLFAALIPVQEWAVIVGRRNEALALSGRELADVRRFVLRYVQGAQGGFDLRVEQIVFVDGEPFRPPRQKEPESP